MIRSKSGAMVAFAYTSVYSHLDWILVTSALLSLITVTCVWQAVVVPEDEDEQDVFASEEVGDER